MKINKLVTLGVLSLFSTALFAVNKGDSPKVSHLPAHPQKEPMAALFVLDTSEKTPKLMEGTQLSRHKPRKLCFSLTNVNPQAENRLVEYLGSPAPIKVKTLPSSQVKAEDDSQTHFLIFTPVKQAEFNNNEYVRCWIFDTSDPVGKYNFEIQFNDTVFKGLSFEVLK
ncbi:hypothetical protein [Lonepinella sp. BR2271]|uniref:hypothetical protein n=1 Tax=Lonepinella sp. BR2271 TaxID=3434550 RepID=UPI003F6DA749